MASLFENMKTALSDASVMGPALGRLASGGIATTSVAGAEGLVSFHWREPLGASAVTALETAAASIPARAGSYLVALIGTNAFKAQYQGSGLTAYQTAEGWTVIHTP